MTPLEVGQEAMLSISFGSQTTGESSADHVQSVFLGDSEIATRMRAFDWDQTPLGPVEQWPQSLRTSVSICLASRFPIVLYWGPEYVVLYNDAYSQILGAKHPWALGQTCRNCWSEIWGTIGPMLDGVVNTGKATWSDDLLLMLQRFGYPEECYFSFSFSPVQIESGRVGGIFTAVIETTENVIGERRLRTLRDLAARAVAATSEQEVWQFAANTISENDKDIPFAVLCRVADNRLQVAGTSGIDSTHPFCEGLCESDSELSRKAIQVSRSGKCTELEDLAAFPTKLPCGSWDTPPNTALLLPIVALGQGSSGVLVAAISPAKVLDESYRTFLDLLVRQIATSVAEARSHEEERKRAEALAKLDRAKTLFLSNISHELRTPLTLLLGPTESALASKDGALKGAELEMVHRNELRLLKLVNTLLDFSCIEAGRIDAIYEPTDLCSLTADIASAFRSAMEKAGLRFIVSCEPIDEPVYVDHQMWEKIVLNLLSNAFKFTLEGEVQLTLKRSVESIELTVRDTGVGISPDQISRVFERFHRVENVRARTYEGTGIGLALVEELVKLHGGSTRVESALGAGSSFCVSIPAGTSHLPAERIQAARSRSSTAVSAKAYVEEAGKWLPDTLSASSIPLSENPLNRLQPPQRGNAIVVADDNADMRDYLTHLLREHYIVHAVPDGVEAMKVIRRLRPALVLADVMMPGLDGFGVLNEIRSDEALRSTPVILLSAHAGEESRVEGLQAGADDYLVKPFTAQELIARVIAHVKMANLRREAAEREAQLRAESDIALAASGTGTFRWNPQTDCVEVDANLKRLLGVAPDQAVGTIEDVVRCVHPEDATRFNFALDACRSSADFEMEFRTSLPKDGPRWLYGRAKMQHSDGQPACFVGACTDITSRKNAEELLRESELWLAGQKQAFQAAVNGAPLSESLDVLIRTAIKQFRGEAKCAFYIANAAGTELQHVVGMPEEYARRVFKIGPESLACGLAVHTGEPQITEDVRDDPRWKSWLWLAQHYDYRACWSFPVRTSTGKAIGTFTMCFQSPRQATSRDLQFANVLTNAAAIIISKHQEAEERARAERVLRDSEQRLRLAQQAAGIGTFEWDIRKNEIRWTPELEAMYGLAPETFGGTREDWERLIHPEDRANALKQVGLALRAGTPSQAEWRTVLPDGSTHWILARWQVFADDSGEPVRMAGINIDVTAQKSAEEARRHLAAIVESSEDAIISKDLSGIVKSWNPQAERLFGYRPQEMIGQPIRKIVPPELQDDEDRILATNPRGERIDHFETIRIAKDGRRIDVALTISPIRDENGRIVGASKIVRDITHKKRTEQALRITERLASVGRLAATVAHEINNPLEAVTNLLYLARLADDPVEIQSFLKQADEELKRVAILSRQTLGFYREKNGTRRLRIGSIVASLVSVFTSKARNRFVEIEAEILQDPEIYAIESEIRQLVANLLNNSIEAIARGGTIRVRVTAGRSWDQASLRGVRLTIADSGRGIAPEHRSKLFQPFFTVNKEVGTGLGLWVSKGIVERHGGDIRFKTRVIPGKSGTTFTVFLPSDATPRPIES